MAGRYIIRLDDIAPHMAWDRYQRVAELFTNYNVKPLLGVVPDLRDPQLLAYGKVPVDFWQEMRERRSQGWEIALHGYTHVYDSDCAELLGDVRRSEFAGHPYDEQLRRLRAGRDILVREGLDPIAFMAPSHTFDEATLRALKAVGIDAITDGYGFFPFREQGMLFVPQMSERPLAVPFGVMTYCLHLNTASTELFAALERFLEKHSHECIPFSAAANYERTTPIGRFLGRMLRAVAKQKRRGTDDGVTPFKNAAAAL